MISETEQLWSSLRQRLVPLALTFGLLGALAPPAIIGGLAWQRLQTQAHVYAKQSAAIAQTEANLHGYIWPYRMAKLLPQPAADISQVQIISCDQRPLYQWRDDAAATRWRLRAQSPIMLRGERLATVTVHAKAQTLLWQIILTTLISTCIGLLLALLVYYVPKRAIRLQGQRLDHTKTALSKAQQELEATNDSLRQRVEAAVEELRTLSAAYLNTQDDERTRIARELHDGLGQNISALRLELERAQAQGASSQAIEEAKRLCQQTLRELRHVIEDLQPIALEGGALSEVLRDMAERFELATGIATFFKHRGHEDCPPRLAASVLRVFQESLHNISHHAQATEVGVTLEIQDGQLTLTVHDDGIGFDPQQPHTSGGHGLRNMRARARLLDGSCELISAPDEGCTLTFSLPITAE